MENIEIKNAENVTITGVEETPRKVIEVNEEGIPKSVAESRAQRQMVTGAAIGAGILGLGVIGGAIGIVAVQSLSRDGLAPVTESNIEEETEIKTPEKIGDEIELDMSKAPQNQESSVVESTPVDKILQEIKENRTYHFSMLDLEVLTVGGQEVQDKENPEGLSISSGRIGVTEFPGLPHEQKTTFRAAFNEEQIVKEWNERRTIKGESPLIKTLVLYTGSPVAGQEIRIKFFNEKNEEIRGYDFTTLLGDKLETSYDTRTEAIELGKVVEKDGKVIGFDSYGAEYFTVEMEVKKGSNTYTYATLGVSGVFGDEGDAGWKAE